MSKFNFSKVIVVRGILSAFVLLNLLAPISNTSGVPAVSARPIAGDGPSLFLAEQSKTPSEYLPFLSPPDYRPALLVPHSMDTLYNTIVEKQQPSGPYRTTVSIDGVPDLQRLQALGAPIVSASQNSATVLVNRLQLEKLAKLHFLPKNTSLLTHLHDSIGMSLSQDATTRQIADAPTSDSDSDGLNDTEEGWWCTFSNNPDSDNDGVSDGTEVQALRDWVSHNPLAHPPTRPASGKPFAGWPLDHPGCYDADYDSVPDAVEVFEFGLNPNRESTSLDKYDDGQKLFGFTNCPGGAGGCGYGALPRARDGQWISSNLPSWVKPPFDNPFVAAFPVIDVSVVPGSWQITRVTTVTTQQGQMSQTTNSYQTTVTRGESDSIANTESWNNWEEVSEAVSRPLNRNRFGGLKPDGSPPLLPDWGWHLLGATQYVLGDTFKFAGEKLCTHEFPAGCLAGAPLHTLGTISSSQGSQILRMGGWSIDPDGVAPNQVQGQGTGGTYDVNQLSQLQSSLDNQASLQANLNTNLQTLSNSMSGVQYAINRQGDLLARGLHEVSYAISQPRLTETHTNGHSWGGAQTTTHEVSEEHSIANGQAFTTGQNWSTAWATDSSHAANLVFTYRIRNTGTDYAYELTQLVFNIYLGNDTNPLASYPAWQLFPEGTLHNLFPVPGPNSDQTFTLDAAHAVPLTLDQMRRIDMGEKLTVVPQGYAYGDDQVFHENALQGGITVFTQDESNPGSSTIPSYIIPTWGQESTQDVLARFFPVGVDADHYLNSLSTPRVSGGNLLYDEHFVSDIAWWNIYQSCDEDSPTDCENTGSTPLRDQAARAGSSLFLRFNRDSDRDGYPDRTEVQYGTDKDDPVSHPEPELLAGYITSTVGSTVTVKLALENTGSFDAYGIQAIMYSPDGTTTVNDNRIGGNGRVRPGAHVAVGSFIEPVGLAAWPGSAPRVYTYGSYTGAASQVYTFTVSTPGIVGQGNTAITWTDGTISNTLDLGSNYRAPLPIIVTQGLKIGLDSSTTGGITSNSYFTVTARSSLDTFSYIINNPSYTPPVILVSYSDPQGSHRFITPVELTGTLGLGTPLSPTYSNGMLKGVGLDIVATAPFTPTGTNLTNFVVNSPHSATIQNAHLYLDFVSDGEVVGHLPYTMTLQSGPTVVPVSWSTSAFSQTYNLDGDNILVASWTDSEGTVIDSAARPFNTFAADPSPIVNTAPAAWDIGTVVQGAQLQQTISLVNTGIVPLNAVVSSTNPNLTLSGAGGILSVAPAGTKDVVATLDTTGIPPGPISMTLSVRTSDPNPARQVVQIPVVGTVNAPTGPANAFDVPYRPWDKRVRVYGNVNQFTPVDFTQNIPPDDAAVQPCKVFDASGNTSRGAGRYCTDFVSGTASYQLFGNGSDGSLTISSDTVDSPIDSPAVGTVGSTTLSATNASFTPGQQVLIIQSQGTGVGTYQRNKIVSYATGTITLETPLNATYTTGAQVIVLKQYTNVTISSGRTWIAKAWNGVTGGVLAFLASGTVTVNGAISATARGYRGGAGANSWPNVYGLQGESITGTGGGSNAANATGGGAGVNGGGGGGGGYATSGSVGQNRDIPSGGDGGAGGGTAGTVDLTTMLFGGGAGGGGGHTGPGGSGGAGGGTVFIAGVTLVVAGTVASNGADGTPCPHDVGGGGGGGSGGSILLKARTATLGASLVSATAGSGARGFYGCCPGAEGWGGAGGTGRIRVEYCDSAPQGSTNPPASTQHLNCYIADKPDATTARLNVPDQITNGQNYLMQFGLRYPFSGQGNQLEHTRVLSQTYQSAIMNALISNVGAGGPISLTLDIGDDSTPDYNFSGSVSAPTVLTPTNLASAFNTYISAHPSGTGYVDVPIRVYVDRQADVMLTNLGLTLGPGLDLSVGPGDLRLGCPGGPSCLASEGNTVPITVTVSNSGPQNASSAVVGYYVGDPHNGGRLLGNSYVPAITAGGVATATFGWNTLGFTSQQTLYASIDPSSSISETNELNNIISQTLYIKSRADLNVSSINLDHTDRVAGEPISATFVISNGGETNSPTSNTRFTYVGEREVTRTLDLPASSVPATSTVSVGTIFTPIAFGLYTLTVSSDISNTVNESNEVNNARTQTIFVGLPTQDIDAGGANDLAYSGSGGYGYLNGSTYDFGGNSVTSTVRYDGSGQLRYRFDGLQPGRFYHADATFYQQGDTLTQTVLFDGVTAGQPVRLPDAVTSTASILVPSDVYADNTMTVTVQRSDPGFAFISRLRLKPVEYTYIDAGGANDAAYTAARGYGYLNGSISNLGGTDPLSTYRTTFTDTVNYRFDHLTPSKKYMVDLTMYDGASSARRQSVMVDTNQVAGCGNLPLNAIQRVQCAVDPTTYNGDGSVVVGVQCVSCSGPRVNEISLEEDTRDISGPIPTPTATPTRTNTPIPTPTSSVQTNVSSFAAQWSGNVVQVTWGTTSEYRTDQFELWRSPTINPATWTQVNAQASLSNCATTTTPHSYGFTDTAVASGQTYYYMLTWSGTSCGGPNGGYPNFVPAVPPAPTPTNTATPLPTNTPTRTPTAPASIVGHVNWQGRPAQPNALQQLPITLTLKLGAIEVDYPGMTTDANGYFTVSQGTLPNGTYNWRVKGPKYLANVGQMALTGSSVTSAEMGLMRVGDCNSDNGITVQDFNIFKPAFGRQIGDPGYDDRAEFTGDHLVSVSDFNLLKGNFGVFGSPPIHPGAP